MKQEWMAGPQTRFRPQNRDMSAKSTAMSLEKRQLLLSSRIQCHKRIHRHQEGRSKPGKRSNKHKVCSNLLPLASHEIDYLRARQGSELGNGVAEMNNGEIIQQGRQRMDDIDSELAKGKRTVMDTESTAAKTAAELKKQTDQMGRVVNDLNEIEFSMQRASKVLRDITRGLATDKCALQILRCSMHMPVVFPNLTHTRVLQVYHVSCIPCCGSYRNRDCDEDLQSERRCREPTGARR